MYKNNNAFTLLEMLIVIFIVSIISFTMIVKTITIYNTMKVNNTINLIGSSYNFLQTKAIINNEKGYIVIENNKISAFLNNKLIGERKIEKNINITMSFKNNQIHINKNGNIASAGHILINCGKIKRKMIFTIGQGRYYVQK